MKSKESRTFMRRMGQAARGKVLQAAEKIGGKEYKDRMKIQLRELKI